MLEFSNQIPSIVWNLIIAITAILVGLLIKVIVTRLFKIYAEKKETDYSLFRSVIVNLGKAITFFYPVVSAQPVYPLNADGKGIPNPA